VYVILAGQVRPQWVEMRDSGCLAAKQGRPLARRDSSLANNMGRPGAAGRPRTDGHTHTQADGLTVWAAYLMKVRRPAGNSQRDVPPLGISRGVGLPSVAPGGRSKESV